jgi:hypothetical protein
MTYDSRPETREHIEQVGSFIADCRLELLRRAQAHDRSKLEDPEREAFDRMTPLLKTLTYGTEEYRQSLKDLGPALQHHYANNSHHPEHYPSGIAGMDLFDVLEMVCDWKAAAMRVKGDGSVGMETNIKRFDIDSQLAQIIQNSLDRWPT